MEGCLPHARAGNHGTQVSDGRNDYADEAVSGRSERLSGVSKSSQEDLGERGKEGDEARGTDDASWGRKTNAAFGRCGKCMHTVKLRMHSPRLFAPFFIATV